MYFNEIYLFQNSPVQPLAGVALFSLQTLPWRHCHHCHHCAGVIADVALAVLRPPLHGRRHPPLGPWPFCRLPSAIGVRPGLCPFIIQLFQVDLLDCLGFDSHPDGRAARLCGRQCPSLGLCLLGRPLGVLDIQQGRLRFVIRNIARSLLLLVILVPSGLVPLSGRHHPGKSNAGAGVRLQCTSTFVMERTAPAPWSLISHC